jgi:hypothetical protein
MPLIDPDLERWSTPLIPRRRRFSANWSRALILGALFFATMNSSLAQDADALPTGKSNSPYPAESEITFQWNYSCPRDQACTFKCPGGGADHLTRLDIYLGSLPVGGDQQHRAPAILYDFSSRGFQHGSGFSIGAGGAASAGTATLSCQVSGMMLDYSGPPPKKSKPSSSGNAPAQ